jgi:hypothetical protein
VTHGVYEVLTSHDLTVEQWDPGIFPNISSSSGGAHHGRQPQMPIQVKMDLTKKKGDAITIGIRSQIEGAA